RRQCALGLVDIGALSELPRQKPVCSTGRVCSAPSALAGSNNTKQGRLQWAPSWSNARRQDTIFPQGLLPTAKASPRARSSSRQLTAQFVVPIMSGLHNNAGYARPRCQPDHSAKTLAQLLQNP